MTQAGAEVINNLKLYYAEILQVMWLHLRQVIFILILILTWKHSRFQRIFYLLVKCVDLKVNINYSPNCKYVFIKLYSFLTYIFYLLNISQRNKRHVKYPKQECVFFKTKEMLKYS